MGWNLSANADFGRGWTWRILISDSKLVAEEPARAKRILDAHYEAANFEASFSSCQNLNAQQK